MNGFLRVWRRVVAHWRAIVVLLILAWAAAIVLHSQFVSFELGGLALLLVFVASQLFWISRILDLGERFIPGKRRRASLTVIVGLVYLFVFTYTYPEWHGGHTVRASDYRLQSILILGAFWWWFVGSMSAFLLLIAFGILDRAARGVVWACRKAQQGAQPHLNAKFEAVTLSSPGRRRFLEQTAVLVSATPFVAAGYGLFYERKDVEVVRQRIRLARLPKAFENFHIAQLSDIHLGVFTTREYIRRCVTITNGLKPDLIALTGDYVAWDPAEQDDVVRALASLRAPYGVFGCLGNHEATTEIEPTITRSFAAQGIRILRQERAPIRIGDDMLNLIGMDAPIGDSDEEWYAKLNRLLQQVKELMIPGTVNILLSHYPYVFDRVADFGMDLTLSGDIHGGGQLSLDFLHPGLNLGTLVGISHVRGWYGKQGSQLYVNRGIGTTGFPIRFGARPEITLFELTRT